ncbi:unnamed protein product, partial [Rotaria sp. Silwood2]
STATMTDTCAICITKTGVLKCQGCQVIFCSNDYNLHRTELDRQLDGFANEINIFRDMSSEASTSLKSLLIDQIDTWEMKSIQRIKETAEEARQQVRTFISSTNEENSAYTREIAEQLQRTQQNHDFDERDLMKWKARLDELTLSITKPNISVDEQQSENPFITKIFVNEKDHFEQICGLVCIEEDGHLARHKFNLFGGCGEIRGKRQYSIGIHRIRFKIEQLDAQPWWFLGIISKSTPMQQNSQNSPSAYGWAGHNEVYMNGQCLKNTNGYISEYSKGDIIELILDCDHRLIRMINIRSMKSYETNVDLSQCPFPWMIHLNLFHMQTRIRINP